MLGVVEENSHRLEWEWGDKDSNGNEVGQNMAKVEDHYGKKTKDFYKCQK